MHRKAISSFVLAGLFLVGTMGIMVAQLKSKTRKVHKPVSITGCLTKGDEAGEYAMKTSDGKLYGLTSKHVILKNHIGHTVGLSGYIVPESDEKPEKIEARSSGTAATRDIDMTVTKLKMISTSCTQ